MEAGDFFILQNQILCRVTKLKLTGFFAGPLLFLIVFFLLKTFGSLNLEACKVLALAAWMVSWWVTEAVHVSVTALVPMAMLPI